MTPPPANVGSADRGRRRDPLLFSLLLLWTALAFATAFDAGFVLDTPALVQKDPRVLDPTAANLWSILTDDLGGEARASGGYRPLTTLTYALDHALWGDSPWGYLLTDVLLHAASVLLLARMLRSMGLPRLVWFGTALLWAAHPVAVEAVTNIAGRADALAALCVLLGIGLHRAGRSTGLGLCALAAACAKENGVVLLPLLLAHDLTFGAADPAPDRWRRRFRTSYLPCLLALLLWSALRALAVDAIGPPPVLDNPLLLLSPLWERICACAVLLDYARLVLFPLRLTADASFDCWPVDAAWFRGLGVAATALWTALLWLCWRSRLRAPAAAFAGMWWFVTIAPVSNVLVPIGTVFGERLCYLPAIGGLLLPVLLLQRLTERYGGGRPLFAPLLAAAAVALLVRTTLRQGDWTSNLTLWRAAVATVPDSFKANSSYAVAVYEDAVNHDRLAADIDTVLRHAERAVAIAAPLPSLHQPADALSNLGAFYREKARLVAPGAAAEWRQKARAQYQAALRREAEAIAATPADSASAGSWRLHLGWAQLLREDGDRRGAAAEFAATAAAAPGPEALLPLAELQRDLQRPRDGAVAAARVVLIDPSQLRAWGLLQECFAAMRPGAVAVERRSNGAPAFRWQEPELRTVLTEAAQAQYDAMLRLHQHDIAADFRLRVERDLRLQLKTP